MCIYIDIESSSVFDCLKMQFQSRVKEFSGEKKNRLQQETESESWKTSKSSLVSQNYLHIHPAPGSWKIHIMSL